jgi:hypothetical protein
MPKKASLLMKVPKAIFLHKNKKSKKYSYIILAAKKLDKMYPPKKSKWNSLVHVNVIFAFLFYFIELA